MENVILVIYPRYPLLLMSKLFSHLPTPQIKLVSYSGELENIQQIRYLVYQKETGS